MVRTIEDKNNTPDAVTSKLFLSSITSWYKEKGVKCEVEKVSKIFTTKNIKAPQVAITLNILDKLPKCRAQVIDDEGNIKTEYDEVNDENKPLIEIIENPEQTTFFMKLGKDESSKSEEEEYIINTMSSAYPLFNHCFQKTKELPEGNKKTIVCTHEEMLDNLPGIVFIANSEKRKYKGEYNVLIAGDVPVESETVENNHKSIDEEFMIPKEVLDTFKDTSLQKSVKELLKNSKKTELSVGEITTELKGLMLDGMISKADMGLANMELTTKVEKLQKKGD